MLPKKGDAAAYLAKRVKASATAIGVAKKYAMKNVVTGTER